MPNFVEQLSQLFAAAFRTIEDNCSTNHCRVEGFQHGDDVHAADQASTFTVYPPARHTSSERSSQPKVSARGLADRVVISCAKLGSCQR